MTSLRGQVFGGGVYLSLRQGLGMFVGFVGVLLLTRTIGPGTYGLYAAALSVYTYLFSLSQLGIGVYLIRHEGEIVPEEYHQAFSLLLLLGIGAGMLGLLALPLVATWTRLESFVPVAATMLIGLPLGLLALPPLAHLERALDYRRVALVELVGQIIYYVITLPLAFMKLGVWAPVIGWWCQQVLTVSLLYKFTGYRPRWHWEPARLRNMISYGLGFSASIWVWQLRMLVNPLIVGRYVGAEAVGFVALTIRLVEYFSFVKGAAWRLSIAALAKLQGDRVRLTKALTEGIQLQIIALGPLLLGFALIGHWLLPILFGESWLPVIELFPFVAVGCLVNALFNLNSSALYVLRHNWAVTVFHLVHIILFAGAAWLLVARLGVVGYGWAEIAALLSYGVIYLQTMKYVGQPRYQLAWMWTFALSMAFFWQRLGIFAFFPLLGILVWPNSWRAFRTYWRDLRFVWYRKEA